MKIDSTETNPSQSGIKWVQVQSKYTQVKLSTVKVEPTEPNSVNVEQSTAKSNQIRIKFILPTTLKINIYRAIILISYNPK